MSDDGATQAQAATATGDSSPTRDQVLEALKVVIDPEIGINIVDIGLVYDVAVDDGEVGVTFTLTSMGCPIGPMIEQQIQQAVSLLPGVESVRSEMVFRPPWSPEMMSEEAKAALGYF